MSHFKVSTSSTAVAEPTTADEVIYAEVVVFDTTPPQTAFMQLNQPANIRAFAGFEATFGLSYEINLEMMQGYRFMDPPLLWQQPDGTYGTKTPPGFTVFFAPSEPTKLSIVDDFQNEEQGGVFIFRMLVVDANDQQQTLDPTIVNRPIVNGSIKASRG
ncbi:MAG: hypothetical protein SX243_14460 [Acidobacteriota bacterium]|nr:hypothetical protein [Acidobacteriota bacterium]